MAGPPAGLPELFSARSLWFEGSHLLRPATGASLYALEPSPARWRTFSRTASVTSSLGSVIRRALPGSRCMRLGRWLESRLSGRTYGGSAGCGGGIISACASAVAGLLLQRPTRLGQQPRVLHRDDSLSSEIYRSTICFSLNGNFFSSRQGTCRDRSRRWSTFKATDGRQVGGAPCSAVGFTDARADGDYGTRLFAAGARMTKCIDELSTDCG
jgi:hypothetical protein